MSKNLLTEMDLMKLHYAHIYVMCAAEVTSGGSHMHLPTAPTKDSALGHQPKGMAVLWKWDLLRSEWHSRAFLRYFSVCVGTHGMEQHTSKCVKYS